MERKALNSERLRGEAPGPEGQVLSQTSKKSGEAPNHAHTLHEEEATDPNSKDENGWTPLHFAACECHEISDYMAKLLIQHGADVNSPDNQGERPLHCAIRVGNTAVVKLLLEAKVDVNATDGNDEFPLDIAMENCSDECIGLLVGAGARHSTSRPL